MFYHLMEASHVAMRPARVAADGARMFFRNPYNPLSYTSVGRSTAAALEVFERTTRRYDKPVFGILSTNIGDTNVAVTEEVVWSRTFCKIIHFKRAIAPSETAKHPRILLVAPVSGHYATLLRGTVEAFLPDHEVYITDWQNARDIPVSEGNFDLDDYIDYVMDMFRHFGGDVHVFAVCQPSVPVLAAVARMEAMGDANVPRSLTLAGGPVDTRVSPTVVNKLAVEKGTDWFRRNVINTVPWPCGGYGRTVYPGFLQLTGFMTMNLDRHMKAHKDLFFHLVDGDGDSAEKHREFYDEYLAVMDLTAEFYLQTIESVFVDHRLAKGTMTHRNAPVDLTAIRRVPLMTIEGEKDDITGIGQCRAALDLCENLPGDMKQHFECPRVGHYGVFNGSRFRSEITPRMRHFMRRFDDRTAATTTREFRPQMRVIAGNGLPRANSPDGAAFTFAGPEPEARDRSPAAAVETRAQADHTSTNPFASFGMMSPVDGMRLWSMTGHAMMTNWAMLNGVAPAKVGSKV